MILSSLDNNTSATQKREGVLPFKFVVKNHDLFIYLLLTVYLGQSIQEWTK